MSPDTGPFPREPMNEHPRVAPDEPSAEVKPSRWPGWIWAVPLAAILIVAYLAFKQIVSAGPSVTVIFPQAAGIEAGQTNVEYDGLKVGHVTAVKLEKDMHHVRATLSLDSEMAGHLGPGTKFWIAGASLSNLSSISSIISGPKIGMEPQPGKKQKTYEGLAEAPVVPETRPGQTYLLHAATLGNISSGSQVYFHDMGVGKVEQTSLEPDQTFNIKVFIRKPYNQLVHVGTRFWNAGAVNLSMQGSGPQVQLQSLPALFTGALDFETPSGTEAGREAPQNYQFRLFPSRTAAEYSVGPEAVLYSVMFGAKAGSLAPDAPVKLAGTQVGSVESAQLVYDPDSGHLQERAVIAIDPDRIALSNGKTWPAHNRDAVDAFMNRLIAQGLRARAGSSIPMVGSEDVTLDFVQGAQPATLVSVSGSPPEIPTAPGGAGIGGILTAVNGVANKLDGIAAKLNTLPLDQIADNIQTVTGRLATLSKSPKLTQSVDDLEASLENVKQVTSAAKADLPSVIRSLRSVATNAEHTIGAARQLISSTAGNGPVGLNQAGLGQTLYELNRAAVGVRELADYLDRHPSALIKGR
jgi:paraquat-inducible protein B